jgi:hypothetical protein
VLDFDGVVICAVEPARAAAPLLKLEEPRHAWADRRMTASSCTPIHPISVIRTACPLHFPMVPYGRLGMAGEGSAACWRLKTPPFALVDAPILPDDPVFGLVRMAVDGPAPSLRVQRVVHCAKDPCTGDLPVIIAPPLNAGGERGTQRALFRVLVAGDGLVHWGPLSSASGVTGSDEGFAPMQTSSAIATRLGFPHGMLSDVQAKKIAARFVVRCLPRMGAPRFTGLQSEPHGAEPCRGELLTAFHDGVVLVEDHEVIRGDSHVGRWPVAAATPWESLGDGRLHTVERAMRPQGRYRAAWPRPGLGRKQGALVEHPSFAPRP